MAKVAEKLTILLETGHGFLIRLYNTKIKYTPESKTRPALLVDPVYAKVVAAFGKKFPEIPTDLDKVCPPPSLPPSPHIFFNFANNTKM
jgi:hypothetical protein